MWCEIFTNLVIFYEQNYSGLRTAKVIIMANMSADILREIIQKGFGIDPKKVILSGEISPEKTWISSSMKKDERAPGVWYNVFSFCVKDSFHELDVVIYTEYGDNDPQIINYKEKAKYKNLALALEAECPDCVFILEMEDSIGHTNPSHNYHKATIFKAPDWKEYLRVNKKDIARWEEWLAK
jgi:hypothetical protein